ncbi:MAG: DUF6108 family protein [Porphyromonadaceae bacterium]|nr:DUF6108 family protein [Porphyromonadaceae bacterium]
MKRTGTFIFCCMMLFFVASVQGQDLKINSIFEKYGKLKGSTMVILSGEAVQNYRLSVYRSITLRYEAPLSDNIQQCLNADKQLARKIKEVIRDGAIRSGYYQLPDEGKKINRYILFKIGDDQQATLIYMEGDLKSEELINKLFIRE